VDWSKQQQSNVSQQLLLSIAEQLKLPMVQIARQAELGTMGMSVSYDQLQTMAENALQLIDGYSLGLQLDHQFNYELATESVSVSSVLYDADQQLRSLARLYDVQLELNIGGKFGPVLVHRKALQSAIVGLASALIEALPAQVDGNCTTLQLATHRCRYGIVAGVYANVPGLSREALKRGRKLYGTSRQPLVEISHTSGAGIFVADAIFRAMKLKLHVSRHNRLYGLGVILRPSSQMALV
jgi:hypothetical protein